MRKFLSALLGTVLVVSMSGCAVLSDVSKSNDSSTKKEDFHKKDKNTTVFTKRDPGEKITLTFKSEKDKIMRIDVVWTTRNEVKGSREDIEASSRAFEADIKEMSPKADYSIEYGEKNFTEKFGFNTDESDILRWGEGKIFTLSDDGKYLSLKNTIKGLEGSDYVLVDEDPYHETNMKGKKIETTEYGVAGDNLGLAVKMEHYGDVVTKVRFMQIIRYEALPDGRKTTEESDRLYKKVFSEMGPILNDSLVHSFEMGEHAAVDNLTVDLTQFDYRIFHNVFNSFGFDLSDDGKYLSLKKIMDNHRNIGEILEGEAFGP